MLNFLLGYLVGSNSGREGASWRQIAITWLVIAFLCAGAWLVVGAMAPDPESCKSEVYPVVRAMCEASASWPQAVMVLVFGVPIGMLCVWGVVSLGLVFWQR